MPAREGAGNEKTSHDCCVGKLVMTLTSGEINHPDTRLFMLNDTLALSVNVHIYM